MFGRNDAPGPGVSKDGPKVRDFFLFFELYGRKFWIYCMLGLLYTCCMLPFLYASFVLYFITEGTALGIILSPTLLGMCIFAPGLVYVIRNYSWEKHSWYVRDYFRNVWQNLKQSLLMFIIDVIVFTVLLTAIQSYLLWNQLYLAGVCFALLLFVMSVHTYIYVIMVTFNMKLFAIIKNAVILTMAKLPVNFMLMVCAIVAFYASFLTQAFAYAVVTLITVPFVALMLTFFPSRVVKKLMIKEKESVKVETLFDDNSDEVKVHRLR